MATYTLTLKSPLSVSGDDIYAKPNDGDFSGVDWIDDSVGAIEIADTNAYEIVLDETKGYIFYLNAHSQSFVANPADDVITAVAHGLLNGETLRFKGLDLPAGLEQVTLFYVRDRTNDTFKVALTGPGDAVDITDIGTGTMTFTSPAKRSKAGDGEDIGVVSIAKPAVLAGEGEVDGYTQDEALRLILSAVAGKVTATSTSFVARSADDSKDRITATTTIDGDRTVVTLDAS